ncbi:MAG TPA: PKD domain-containing protein [Edaphocola sp.]|nr:PKD domain-containing protein [Edaphocola sp.]
MKKFLSLLVLFIIAYNFSFGIIIGDFKQTKYRWRNNDGNEATATWKANVNTAISLTNAQDTLRLRTEYYGNGMQGNINAGISYSKNNGATWTKITTADTNDFKFVSSTLVSHNTTTTNQFGTSTGGSYSAGIVVSQDTPIYNITVNSGSRTEMEWVIVPTLFVENNKTYLFEHQGVSVAGVRAQLTTNFACTNPSATFPTAFERCDSGQLTLSPTSITPGATAVWRKSATGPIIGIGNSIQSPIYSSNTSVYVKVHKDGCTTTGQNVNIVINPAPIINMVNNLDTCLGTNESITLNIGTQPAGSTILWDDNSSAITRTINQSGTYYVQVTNNKSCVSYDTINVIVRPKPIVDLAVNGTTMCIGETKVLDAGSGGQNGGSYYWNTGDQTQTINVNSPGTYIAFVTAPNGCSQSDTINVTQNGYAPSLEGIKADALAPKTFKFAVINPQYVIGYQWDFGNGNLSSDSIPQHTFPGDGNYLIKVIVSSNCADRSDSAYVNIIGLGLNPQQELNKQVHIFPNPNNNGVLNLSLANGIIIKHINIYNQLGQNVLNINNYKPSNTTSQIFLPENLAIGIYNIELETNKGKINKKLELIK